MKALKREEYIKLKNGHELFFRSYSPEKAQGTLLIVHGFGEHSGRYEKLAQHLTEHHWQVYAYDQRGHGKTPGTAVYLRRFEDLVEDLQLLAEFICANEKEKKLVLLGHSFGGQVSINYLAKQPREIRAAILSSPNVQLGFSLPWFKKYLGPIAAQILPKKLIDSGVDPNAISRDPEIVRDYINDPLVHRKITLRFGSEILKNLNIVMGKAENIKIPCFVFHGGEDRITSLKGTRDFFEKIKSKDKTLKIYPGFSHETFNDLGKEQVYSDVVAWLEKHSK